MMVKLFRSSKIHLNISYQKLLILSLIAFGTTALLGLSPGAIDAENNLPTVFISSNNLFQADTFMVIVKNEPWPITGYLGSLKLRFFRSENNQDWVAIAGILINKEPGNYTLSLSVPGKIPYQTKIKIQRRTFPITEFPTTPELTANGFTAQRVINTVEGKENKILSSILTIVTPKSYINKPFSYPLSQVTVTGSAGGYGDIRKFKDYSIQHLGIDLKAPMNTPVYSINDGVIVYEGSLPDYGNTLIIDHGLGVYSLYLHLNEFVLPVKEEVRQGDVIALSGATGYSTGPHLHFSIKVRGATVDPLRFVATSQYYPW